MSWNVQVALVVRFCGSVTPFYDEFVTNSSTREAARGTPKHVFEPHVSVMRGMRCSEQLYPTTVLHVCPGMHRWLWLAGFVALGRLSTANSSTRESARGTQNTVFSSNGLCFCPKIFRRQGGEGPPAAPAAGLLALLNSRMTRRSDSLYWILTPLQRVWML